MVIYRCDRCGRIMTFSERSTMQVGACEGQTNLRLKEKNDLCQICFEEFLEWYKKGAPEDGQDIT